MKTEALSVSEMLVSFSETTQCNIPGDNHRNIKHNFFKMFTLCCKHRNIFKLKNKYDYNYNKKAIGSAMGCARCACAHPNVTPSNNVYIII
jgi:hypothetical protein